MNSAGRLMDVPAPAATEVDSILRAGVRCLRRIQGPAACAARLRREMRRLLWNRQPGVSIAATASIDLTARIETLDPIRGRGAIVIGEGARIGDGVVLAPYGGRIEIGEKVTIESYAVLYGHGGLVIGRDTMIAAHCVIVPASHICIETDRPINSQGETRRGVHIGEDVWIGCGARILDGVTIGNGSVVGAGSVVNQSVAPYSLVMGVPAQIIGRRGGTTPENGQSQ